MHFFAIIRYIFIYLVICGLSLCEEESCGTGIDGKCESKPTEDHEKTKYTKSSYIRSILLVHVNRLGTNPLYGDYTCIEG